MSFHSIFIRYGIPEFMVQRFAYDVQVAVLTENRGNEEPMICCSHAAITPMVSHKRTFCKLRYIGRRPLICGGPVEIRLRGMFYICCTHPLPRLYILYRPANQYTVHPYLTTYR